MEGKEIKEIITNFFVGDTVILMEETEITKSLKLNLGTVGIVSINDTKESLEGWKVVDLEKRFQEAVEKLPPEKINSLMEELIKLNQNNDNRNIN